ncbi:MAG TPA: prolyl oligopeptidase family serine peptidase, partial [Acidimicrobiales bacterium]|nr:prolyl oligopeptidase family serine peptidase [Acidimicrobiales bacterium]
MAPDLPPYPDARRQDIVDELWGRRVPDPYRWLEDPDDPDTKMWSEAQDRLWEGWADAHPGRAALAERILELEPGVRSAPVVVGTHTFWTERRPGQDHAVVWVDDAAGARPLVDPNALDPDGGTTLDGWEPSREGDRLAYLLSAGGDEESRFFVLDVTTAEVLDGPVDRTRYSPLTWLPGGQELLYVRRLPPDEVPAGEEDFHRRLWRHAVGTDADAGDQLLFGQDGLGPDLDPTTYLDVDVTDDGRWAVVTLSLGTAPRTDLWLARLPEAGGRPDWRPVVAGVDAQSIARWDRHGQLWILTDLGAPRRRLVRVDPAAPHPDGWVDVLAEDPDGAVLEAWALAGDRLVAVRLRHALAEVAVHDRQSGAPLAPVTLPGPSSVTLTGRRDEGPEVWVGVEGYATPFTVHPLDLEHATLGAALPAPGREGAARAELHARTELFRSADGTEVRMTVVAPHDGDPDRPRPTVLYGYGGFDIALVPEYSTAAAAWVAAGGVWAVANLRGGSEEGEAWHRAGMREHKHHVFEDFEAAADHLVAAGGVWAVANLRGGSEEGEAWHRAGMREHKHHVFEDFEAAADHLVAAGWTTPQQLGILGGSNGGLLVGAALTRSPERYRAVVCSAPLLDMVRYERFGLGRTWNDEFGTADDAEELGWLLSYSPYHHVEAGV